MSRGLVYLLLVFVLSPMDCEATGAAIAQDDTTDTTSLLSFTSKLSLQINVQSSTEAYAVLWSAEVQSSALGVAAVVSVLSGVTEKGSATVVSGVATGADWLPISGMFFETLSSGMHTFDIQYATANVLGTAGIRRVRLVAVPANVSN